LPEQRGRHAFTLIELLVVMGIIALALAFLIPTLGPASGRSLDAATGQFRADLEGARLIALTERTRTRILVPTSNGNFSSASASPAPWPTDIALRGYLIVSERRTDAFWKQRGKWTRFPQGVAWDSTAGVFPQPSPAPAPTPPGIPIDVGGSGATTYVFNGPYIEFLANGSSNLDPSASPAPAATLADGFVDSSGVFVKKNAKLRFTVTVEPLTGTVSVK
jgi:prepilin-type N-terminal cleavage/methylation domain-containing protein